MLLKLKIYYIATVSSDENMVDLLISKGVDVNGKCEDGLTSLVYGQDKH